jgi:hypothetical protein
VRPIGPEALRAGDVLLMRSAWRIARLMAWNAECPYSHAALVIDRDRVVEAKPPRVRIEPLRELADPERRIEYVDVLRPYDALGQELDDESRDRVAAIARSWVGVRFATTRLPRLAFETLWCHKLGAPAPALRVEPAARPADAVTCTELVFRVLSSACGLELGARRRVPTPFPGLGPGELLEEWVRWRRERGTNHARLACRRAVARRSTGNVDARRVITTDLWSSPDLRMLGRLRLDARQCRSERR